MLNETITKIKRVLDHRPYIYIYIYIYTDTVKPKKFYPYNVDISKHGNHSIHELNFINDLCGKYLIKPSPNMLVDYEKILSDNCAERYAKMALKLTNGRINLEHTDLASKYKINDIVNISGDDYEIIYSNADKIVLIKCKYTDMDVTGTVDMKTYVDNLIYMNKNVSKIASEYFNPYPIKVGLCCENYAKSGVFINSENYIYRDDGGNVYSWWTRSMDDRNIFKMLPKAVDIDGKIQEYDSNYIAVYRPTITVYNR